jgi:hypothetical protein
MTGLWARKTGASSQLGRRRERGRQALFLAWGAEQMAVGVESRVIST